MCVKSIGLLAQVFLELTREKLFYRQSHRQPRQSNLILWRNEIDFGVFAFRFNRSWRCPIGSKAVSSSFHIRSLWTESVLLCYMRVRFVIDFWTLNISINLFPNFRGPSGPPCLIGCNPGCFCDAGYILNVADGRCIPTSSCKLRF